MNDDQLKFVVRVERKNKSENWGNQNNYSVSGVIYHLPAAERVCMYYLYVFFTEYVIPYMVYGIVLCIGYWISHIS